MSQRSANVLTDRPGIVHNKFKRGWGWGGGTFVAYFVFAV